MNTSIFPHTKKSHNFYKKKKGKKESHDITDSNNFYELEFFLF